MDKLKKYTLVALIINIFLAVGAIGGALMMFFWADKVGMMPLLEGMQILPFADVLFKNLVIPGIALFVIIAVPNVISSITILRKHKHYGLFSLICGVILVLWIILQFVIYPFNVMSTVFFIIGLAQVNISIVIIRLTRTDKKGE